MVHVARANLLASYRILLFVGVVMIAVVQQPRADEVHTKTERRDRNGLAEPDRHRPDQARHGFISDEHRNHRQYDRARKGREFPQFAGSKRKPLVRQVRAGKTVSDCRNREGGDVRGHVEPVGHQRHRAKQQAADDLGDHHRGSERDNCPGPALVLVVLLA